jgi:hypothetical protein
MKFEITKTYTLDFDNIEDAKQHTEMYENIAGNTKTSFKITGDNKIVAWDEYGNKDV